MDTFEGAARSAAEIDNLRSALVDSFVRVLGKDPQSGRGRDWLVTLSHVVRAELAKRLVDTVRAQRNASAKQVNYLSMEFLVGRALTNGLLALKLRDEYRGVLRDLGIALEDLCDAEPDPGLGNGGLGRLAACFLDSLATLRLPAFGYGVRYQYGMFSQQIRDGHQTEHPDDWLVTGNPWEFARPEISYVVQFGGRLERSADGVSRWVGTDDLLAVAYDTIVPGHGTRAVATLRLWAAEALHGLDVTLFNGGEHTRALEHKLRARHLTRILYPDDSTPSGRELRLRQEYFLVSASLQDIVRRHLDGGGSLDDLPEKAAVHLNDTHPALSVPELMRLLVDVHGRSWDDAWKLCQRVFSYTNHTLMPEALETWPVDLLHAVLPRHLDIVYELNARFLNEVRGKAGEDHRLLRRLSLIDEEGERRVRMAHLSILASHKINGVSRLHTDLMRQTVFADFATLFPNRFVNKTNGVTPRRWLGQANQGLARLIDDRIGPAWRTDLDQLAALRPLADDAAFRAEFRAVKVANKRRLAEMIERDIGVAIDPASLFDIQIKRIHEYKRQLLNVLHVAARYNAIVADPAADWVPRTVIFGGKAASAYRMAKLVIKLIHDVARRVNQDIRVGDRLKVVFVPNYRVSIAEVLIPAAELSQQISTAGTEASGTGNMKLSLNGALTIGTEDGANIEIREQVGSENMFIVGHTAEELHRLRADGYDPLRFYERDPMLRTVLDQIASGFFSPEEPDRFRPIVDALLHQGDRYFLLADFASYVAGQRRVDDLYRSPDEWTRKAVLNVAGMGPFSSDRTIAEYAKEIWGLRPMDL
ncbi:MAG TPA: glycogen/starch/alpha-glucan phosphorylase [Stellaceae bacterium]